MKKFICLVNLSGTVEVEVEAENPIAARRLAKEQAEIGDVDCWNSHVLATRTVKE